MFRTKCLEEKAMYPMRRRSLLQGIFAVTAVASWAASPSFADQPEVGIDEGMQFPDIVYHDAAGARKTIADARGTVGLVYFWASWCPICRGDMGDVQAFYDRYKDQNVTAIILNFMDPYDPARAWAKEKGYTMPFADSGISGRDPQATTTKGSYTLPRRTPLFFVLDREGKVAAQSVGWTLGGNAVSRTIDALLKASA